MIDRCIADRLLKLIYVIEENNELMREFIEATKDRKSEEFIKGR